MAGILDICGAKPLAGHSINQVGVLTMLNSKKHGLFSKLNLNCFHLFLGMKKNSRSGIRNLASVRQKAFPLRAFFVASSPQIQIEKKLSLFVRLEVFLDVVLAVKFTSAGRSSIPLDV